MFVSPAPRTRTPYTFPRIDHRSRPTHAIIASTQRHCPTPKRFPLRSRRPSIALEHTHTGLPSGGYGVRLPRTPYPVPPPPLPAWTVDLEALLRSVGTVGAGLDSFDLDLDDASLDFDDLAALGDFSGLGPLDFSLDGGGTAHGIQYVPRKLHHARQNALRWYNNVFNFETTPVAVSCSSVRGFFV